MNQPDLSGELEEILRQFLKDFRETGPINPLGVARNSALALFDKALANLQEQMPEKRDDTLSGGPLEIRRNNEYWNQCLKQVNQTIEAFRDSLIKGSGDA